MVSGPEKMTRLPAGDHFTTETWMLAYLASDPKASLQAAMRMGALVFYDSRALYIPGFDSTE